MRNCGCLLLLLFQVYVAVAQQDNLASDLRLAQIDSVLTRVLADQYIAGFSVAVVKNDQIIYNKGFGYRDVKRKAPVTPNTLFAIGSSTKAFTTTLMGLLEKEEKLNLDDKATKYLPGLDFFNDEMNNNITVRDMMCHRTGLPRYDYSWYLFSSPSRDTLLQKIKYIKPVAGIREKFIYNNFMYMAQGMIAEHLTGKTWEENIKEKIFDPLEMKRSNTSLAAFKNNPDAALPYIVGNDSVIARTDYYDIAGMGPAGSINSSSTDMANWLRLWIGGGKFNNKRIVPASFIGDACSSHMVVAPGLPRAFKDIFIANYGLGWYISSYRGHYRVEHSGNIDGFSASVGFFPAEALGIVVLTNQGYSKVPSIVMQTISDRMLELEPIDWNGRAKRDREAARNRSADIKTESDQIRGTKASHSLADYTGIFNNPAYGNIHVSLKNDSLFAKIGYDFVLLEHYHYDVFRTRGLDFKKVNFVFGADSQIESLTVPFQDGPVVFNYSMEKIQLKPVELERFAGQYTLSKTSSANVYLKDGALFLRIPGEPEYEMVYVGKNTFKLKMLNDHSVKFDLADVKAYSASFVTPKGIIKGIRQAK